MTITTKTNDKGEIKIPLKFRKFLGINDEISIKMIIQGKGLYIYPVLPQENKKDDILKTLKKTQGSWAGTKEPKNKAELELKASINRKLAW